MSAYLDEERLMAVLGRWATALAERVRNVDRSAPEKSLLLLKPTKRIPHAGGLRIKPGSPDEVILKSWIDKLTQLSWLSLVRADYP